MPVPVPKRSRLPAHPVVKHSTVVREGQPLSRENTLCDLATCPVATSELSLSSGICNKPFTKHTLRKDQCSFTSTELGVHISLSFDPQLACWGKDRSLCGLTGAANAPISKEKHAEACFLPFSDEESSMTVDFCSGLGAANALNSGYETDSDTLVPLRRWHSSVPWTQTSSNASAKYAVEEHSFLAGGEVGSSYDLPQEKTSSKNEFPTTPFADFVDRVIASDATRLEEHFYMDSRANAGYVRTPRRQQEVAPQSIENVADSAYIKAYRALADPMSIWMGDYIWKVCTTGLSLPQRFVNIGYAYYLSLSL